MGGTIFKIEKTGDVSILTLTLDSVAEDQNRELTGIFSSLIDNGSNKIVLDLSNTVYIASMVLSSMMFFLKKAKTSGGDLVISGVNDRIREILKTTKLDKVFRVFDGKTEAVSYFEGKHKAFGKRGIFGRFLR